MTDRKKPARWRKARFPEAGTRWDTPMNRMVWSRDHGDDVELWRGDVLLALVQPSGNGWHWSAAGRYSGRERKAPYRDIEDAKRDAKAAAFADEEVQR